MTQATTASSPPRLVHHRYEIVRPLGQGGMGTTYLAQDRLTGRQVALKLLGAARFGLLDAFRAEFAALSGLIHPNICHVHDYGGLHSGEDQPAAYYTAEFIDGTTLDRFGSGKRWDDIKGPLNDTLEALRFLHHLGIRHGDVKPENILVDGNGRGVVIDLGCSRPLGDPALGDVSGTPGFIAPELLRGEPADQRADLYSFGITLQSLLSDVESPGGSERSRLEALVARLIDELPSRRPADAGEVLDALGAPDWLQPLPASSPARLFGREAEEAAFEELLAAALAGEPGPRGFYITGPEGVGRTRLFRELKWQCQLRCNVVEGNAELSGAVTSLLARAVGGESPAEGLSGALAARRLLNDEPRPVALFLDDLFLLDEQQRQVWQGLLRSQEQSDRLLLVCTSTAPPDFEADALRVVELAPLTDDQVRSWVHQVFPASEVRVADVSRLTGGFPAAVQALLAQLRAGHFTEDDLVGLAGATPLSERRLRRLGSLDEQQQWALGVLAASGRALDAEQLATLSVETEALGMLLAAGWVERDHDGFRLIRLGEGGKVLAALGEPLVGRLHRTLADALSCEPGGEGPMAERSAACARRAYHLALAGDHDAAEELLLTGAELLARAHPRLWPRAADALLDVRGGSSLLLAAAQIHEAAGHAERALAVLLQGLDEVEVGQRAAMELQVGAGYLELGDAARALEHLGQALEPAGATETRARALDLVARAHIKQGDYELARSAAQEALDSGSADDVAAELEQDLGVAASYLGDTSGARHHLARAAELYGDSAPPRSRYRTFSYEAINEYRAGDAKGAIRGYEKALEIAERHGLGDGVATASLNLGTACHQLGDFGRASRSYERGLPMATALGKVSTEATLRINLAKLHGDIGQFDRAEVHADRAAQAVARGGLEFLSGVVDAVRGEILIGRGRFNEAQRVFERARALFAAEGAPREVAELDANLAEAYLAQGEHQSAREVLAAAAAAGRELGADDLMALVRLLQGRLAMAAGDNRGALARLEEARELAGRVLQPGLQAEVERALSRLSEAQGSPTLADRHRRRARELWERTSAGLPAELREAFWAHPKRAALARSGVESTVTSGRERRLEQLLAINRKLNSSLKTQDVLEATMDAAIELTRAERGFLLLLPPDFDVADSDFRSVRVAVARNLDREKIGRSHLKISRSIAEQVIQTGEPLVTIDARADDRFLGHESVHAMKLKSVAAVPIRAPDGVLGALYLDNRFQRGRFEVGDMDLLLAFGDQVALALTNARLHDELGQRARELEGKNRRIEELARGQARRIDDLVKQVQTKQEVLEHRYDYSNIIGRSPAMQAVFAVLDQVIDVSATVLIQGESGTGKELVARAIHFNGPRKRGPFVAVNCEALPETLLESELFGHVRGAFTGAERDKEGLFVAAKGGSLLLDELGEMPASMQVKLLRVLEQREVSPVGATRPVPVDIRLVCATNRSLRAEVEAGRFREDLFYRLGVVEVNLPPLRERYEDVPELTRKLMERIAKEHGRSRLELTGQALRALLSFPWPGNVRQLENTLTKALLLARGDEIALDDLDLPHLPAATAGRPLGRKSYEEEEGVRIVAALRAERWNVSKVARILGIPRATLYRKMKKLRIKRDG